MGKPTTSKATRKISKKMTRVAGDAQAGTADGEGIVPDAVVPAPLAQDHLQTRRERMLKRVFSKKSTSEVSTGGKKRIAPKQRKDKATVVVDDAVTGDSTGDNDGVDTIERRGRRQLARTTEDRIAQSAVRVATKQAAVTAAAAAAAAAPLLRKTSMNLSNVARHDLFVNELNLFNHVSSMPQFTEDPFTAIQKHLDATLKKLQPQTTDIGRAPPSTMPPSFHRARVGRRV
jgi:hypothetical protein